MAGVLGLTALALVGCSSQPLTPEGCGRVADSAPSVMGAVDASGASTSVPQSFVADEAAHLDLEEGAGAVIESIDQAAVVDISLVDAATGAELPYVVTEGDETKVVPLSALTAQMPGLEPALACAGEGSRFVAALGDGGIDEALAAQLQQAGLSGDASRMLAVVDVHRVLPGAADGSPVYNAGHGLPSIVRSPEGVPGVVVPDAAAPTSTAVETLLKGDGPALAEGDVVTLHVQSVDWTSRSVGTSTWTRESPATAPLAEIGLPEEVVSALDGATVGSQVLVVVPDGESGATIWVVDLLGAAAAS